MTQPTPKILIVDDSRLVRTALCQHLRTHYAIREAEDGESGWQTLLLDPMIQVVITDLEMPGLDGMALLQKIRSSKVKRINTLPVIVNSGAHEEKLHEQALKLGANDFITKDIRAVELVARVDSMLRLAQVQKALEDSRQVLAQKATFDPAIQIATPHLLDVHLSMMWSYLKRHGGDLSIICISLDRTRMGEDGEYAPFLQKIETSVGELLSIEVRKEDCAARTGNCEYTIACTGIDLTGAQAFVERLRASIEALRLMRDERVVKITASAGIANLSQDQAMSVEELRVIAHERLEDAQAQGGNQIIGCPDKSSGEVPAEHPPAELFDPAIHTHSPGMELDIQTAIQWILMGEEKRVIPYIERLMRQIWPLIKLIEKVQREKLHVNQHSKVP